MVSVFWFYVSKAGAQSAGSGKGTFSIVKDLINSENPKYTFLRFSGVIIPSFDGSSNIFANVYLQGIARREGALVRLLEDGEDGSDGNEAVDVGAAVQGVEGDDVLALALRLHLYLIVILLRPDSSTLCKEGSDL